MSIVAQYQTEQSITWKQIIQLDSHRHYNMNSVKQKVNLTKLTQRQSDLPLTQLQVHTFFRNCASEELSGISV